MSNLYPHLNHQHHNNNNHLPAGSFDDYDSIIDGFSINSKAAESDDVSSMHMSEMGGVSVHANNQSPARNNTGGNNGNGNNNNNHNHQINTTSTSTINTNTLRLTHDAVRSAKWEVPPYSHHTLATNGIGIATGIYNGESSPPRSPSPPISPPHSPTSTQSSFKLGSEGSGYYHVGDLMGILNNGDLGIDASDVSAIMHGASRDEEDNNANNNYSDVNLNGDGDGDYVQQHSLPLPDEVKNNKFFDITNVENGNSSSNRQLGPLGDELSYSGSQQQQQQQYNESIYYDSDDDDDDSDYDYENEYGILPNWLAFSSRRTKCVFVTSAALVLGSLVLAVVALGISYGMAGDLNGNGGGGANAVVDADELASVPVVESIDGNNGPTPWMTTNPTSSPVFESTNAPVSSTTGAEESEAIPIITSSPTNYPTTTTPTTLAPVRTLRPITATPSNPPTYSNTSTNDISVDRNTYPPTVAPRTSQSDSISAASLEASRSPTDTPTTSMRPSMGPSAASLSAPSAVVSASPSMPPTNVSSGGPSKVVSASPSMTPTTVSSGSPSMAGSKSPSIPPTAKPSTSPTTSPAPTSSAVPTAHPSLRPTTTFRPTSAPSSTPTLAPSASPSISTKPSWSFGEDADEEGDATFYLMADGGSNWQYWTEKMEELNVEDHKFLVHLGSATRAVDNCEATAYYTTQLSLSLAPIPVYSLPGNNDYPECPNPTQGWEYYQQHMMGINAMHWSAPEDYDVKRQANREENFSFLYKRVLFVGLNMVTNSNANETNSRLEDNINWIMTNVDAYQDKIGAIFIMGYGRLLATENAPFYNAMISFKKQEEYKDLLLVYARRASESELEKNIGGIKTFVELKVGNHWPIMDVRVNTKGGSKGATVEFRDVVEEEVDDEEVQVIDDDNVKNGEDV